MLESKQCLLMKIEGSYGVDAAPTATDAVLTGPVTWGITDGSTQRNCVVPFFGDLGKIPIGTGIDLSFQVEMFGSGTAATPSKPHGLLMRAAGFSETITSTVVYNETSVMDTESVTIWWYNDGILYKATGCVVDSIKFDMQANKLTMMDVKLSGLFSGVATAITDQAMITPIYGTLQIPPVLQNASFSLDSYASNISKCEITVTNKIVRRSSPNLTAGVFPMSVVSRDVKGSIDPEMVALATYNPWTTWNASTTGALAITVGASAGNKWTFAAPNCLKEIPKIGNRGGIRTYSLAFDCIVAISTGNNRLTLTHL